MLRRSLILGIVLATMIGIAIPTLGFTGAPTSPANTQPGHQVLQGPVAAAQEETPTSNFSNVSVRNATFDTVELENVTLTNVEIQSLTIQNTTNDSQQAVTRENVSLDRITVNGTLRNVTLQNLVVSERTLAASLFPPSMVEENVSQDTYRTSIRVLDNQRIDGIVIENLTVQSAEIERVTDDLETQTNQTPVETVMETPFGEGPVNRTNRTLNETPTGNETPSETVTPAEQTPDVTGSQPGLSASEVTIGSIENMTVTGTGRGTPTEDGETPIATGNETGTPTETPAE